MSSVSSLGTTEKAEKRTQASIQILVLDNQLINESDWVVDLTSWFTSWIDWFGWYIYVRSASINKTFYTDPEVTMNNFYKLHNGMKEW